MHGDNIATLHKHMVGSRPGTKKVFKSNCIAWKEHMNHGFPQMNLNWHENVLHITNYMKQ